MQATITTQETGILSQYHDFVWRRDTNKNSAKTLSLFRKSVSKNTGRVRDPAERVEESFVYIFCASIQRAGQIFFYSENNGSGIFYWRKKYNEYTYIRNICRRARPSLECSELSRCWEVVALSYCRYCRHCLRFAVTIFDLLGRSLHRRPPHQFLIGLV